MSLNVAILEHLQKYVKSQPLDIDIEGVEVALNVLAEALNIDLASVTSTAGSLSSHGQSLASIFDAGLVSVGLDSTKLQGPKSGTKEHFSAFVTNMKKRNYFATLEEGTSEYYTKLDELIAQYCASNDVDEAVVRELIRPTPEQVAQAEALKTEGNALLGKADYNGSVAKYTAAIVLNPLNHIFWLNRAVALHKLQHLDRAVLDAEQSTRVSPAYLKAHYRLGLLRSELGQYEKAKQALEAALALAGDDVSTSNDITQHIENIALKTATKNTTATVAKKAPLKKKKTAPSGGGMDLASLMNNPMVKNMAASMMGGAGGDGAGGAGGAGGMDIASLMNNPAVQNMMNNPMMQNMMASMMGGAQPDDEDDE